MITGGTFNLFLIVDVDYFRAVFQNSSFVRFFQSKGRLINFEVKKGIKDTNDLVTAMMNAVK